MKSQPTIDKQYLANILELQPTQLISNIDICEIIESNTALTIKFIILIKEDAHKDLTRQFFIKTIKYNSKNHAYDELSIKEVEFYKYIQNLKDIQLPIAQCFDAYISEDKSKYLLLLEDLSNDFCSSEKVDFTSENIWISAACSLAKFHATFWNLHQMNSNSLLMDTMEDVNSYIKNTYESYEKFINYVENRFDTETFTIFEHALKISVGMETERYKRISSKNNITLIHGDSHIYNYMFSHNQDKAPIIVDFQFWGVGIAARDMAHLTRVSFPENFSEEFHQLLVRKYYEELLAHGVQGYKWGTCWNDYRKQVASMLLIPMIQYAVFNLKYEDWINDIKSLLSNYKLLHCELLET
jgi:hypothetical protein